MPSMANARFAALIVLILAAHVAATNLFKKTERDVHALVERKQAIAPARPVNALLIGGSGMHYGLNARILSEETPYQFLNLGMIVEGNSWANYIGFLDNLEMIKADEIELVIYSSNDFFNLTDSDEFTLKGARAGTLLFDSQSWLQKLSPDDNPYAPYPVDRAQIDPETGDMVFLDGICDIYYPAGEMTVFQHDHFDQVADRARDLAKRFPRAEILFRPWPVSEHKGIDLHRVHRQLEVGLTARGVKVLIPSQPLYDANWACDAPFHPNAKGREALTLLEADKIMTVLQGEG